MGRLSRHRKIKSCDPFFKGPRENNNLSYNVPVKPSELDRQPFPRKAKDLFNCSGKVKKRVKKGPEQKAKKLKLARKEGETKWEYFDRLEKQTAEEVAHILSKDKCVSQKRKEFLKARKEKLRQKRKNVDQEKYKDFTTDNVKFGEVVEAPPNLTKPRHALCKNDNKLKVNSLLLQRTLTTPKKGQGKETIDRDKLKSKKRKHMSAIEQQISDKRRMEAIVAYRKLKKKPAVNT